MILAFLGDVVGKTGRHAVAWATPRIRALHGVDLVIANAENSAGGFGINPAGIAEMEAAGVAFFTVDSRVRYGHFIWHLFVLAGTSCHFFAVLGYAA